MSFDTIYFTCDDLITSFHRYEDLVPILHTYEDLIPILHTYEDLVPILHKFRKLSTNSSHRTTDIYVLVLHTLKNILKL